jgi:hypothetical protein
MGFSMFLVIFKDVLGILAMIGWEDYDFWDVLKPSTSYFARLENNQGHKKTQSDAVKH